MGINAGGFTDINGNAFTASTKFQCLSATQFIMTSVVVYQSSMATISYYPIRNGWTFWYGKNGLFYYKSIQDYRSYDLQNLGLKIHNFSLELKQSKTPPAALRHVKI